MAMCEDCALDGDETPATQEWDATGPGTGGWWLCDACASRWQEASSEPDYHAVTLDELYQRAAREKREHQ